MYTDWLLNANGNIHTSNIRWMEQIDFFFLYLEKDTSIKEKEVMKFWERGTWKNLEAGEGEMI